MEGRLLQRVSDREPKEQDFVVQEESDLTSQRACFLGDEDDQDNAAEDDVATDRPYLDSKWLCSNPPLFSCPLKGNQK